MRFLLKPIFATLVLSLMSVPSTMRASWIQYVFAHMPDDITVQVIGTIPASQSSRYLEEKIVEYDDSFNPPTTDMAQTTKTLINRGTTKELELTQRIHYTDFSSIKDPRGYVYKRYVLNMFTPLPKSGPEPDIPIISICHDRYGRPQISYNDEILTPEPMNPNGTLRFRWIQ